MVINNLATSVVILVLDILGIYVIQLSRTGHFSLVFGYAFTNRVSLFFFGWGHWVLETRCLFTEPSISLALLVILLGILSCN